MSNPFKKIAKNARETKAKKQWEGVKETSETYSKICDSCGAPRPKKTDIRNCAYCGFEFMLVDTKIIIDR